jgi:hypothetical protein
MKCLHKQNEVFELDSFTGCLSPLLRPMMDVLANRLDVNQNFPDKELLMMRVTEEANLCGINFVCS